LATVAWLATQKKGREEEREGRRKGETEGRGREGMEELTFQQQLLQLRAHHIDSRASMAGAFLDSSGFVQLAYHAVEIALC
jgi:hypothetical protein